MVRALLGESAIAARKLECGASLTILGITVASSSVGVRFTVCPEKARKWLATIEKAVASGHLCAGEAQKLAGRLNWATQQLFHKLGRAMI